MDNKQIVDKIVRTNLLDDIINKITNNSSDEDLKDLRQDIYISLLKDDKLPGLYERGELNYYLSRIVMNNVCSSTSGYYRKYKLPLKRFEPFYRDDDEPNRKVFDVPDA